jgi:Secretion system C-terminal sorting domain
MHFKKTKLLIIACLLISLSLALSSYHNGAALYGNINCTGSETTNPVGCSNGSLGCHTLTPSKFIDLRIELDSNGIATTRYIPKQQYTVKIIATNTGNNVLPKFGFQIGAIKGDTATALPINAGIWDTLALPNLTHFTTHKSGLFEMDLLEQSDRIPATNGNGGNGTVYSESFSWQAPDSGFGNITLWGVLNAINADTHIGGDYWNIKTQKITEGKKGPVGVEALTLENNFAFQNPISEELKLFIGTNFSAGAYTIKVIDLNGIVISSKIISICSNQKVYAIPMSTLKSGYYLLSITNSQYQKQFKVIKL